MKSLKWTIFLLVLVLGLVGCGKPTPPDEDDQVFKYQFTNVADMSVPEHNCHIGMGAELRLMNHDRSKSTVEVQVSKVGGPLDHGAWIHCAVGVIFTVSTDTYVNKSEQYKRDRKLLQEAQQKVQERLDKIHRLDNPTFRLLEKVEGTPARVPDPLLCSVNLGPSSHAKMRLLGESSEDWLIKYTPDGSGDDCPAGEILIRKSKER